MTITDLTLNYNWVIIGHLVLIGYYFFNKPQKNLYHGIPSLHKLSPIKVLTYLIEHFNSPIKVKTGRYDYDIKYNYITEKILLNADTYRMPIFSNAVLAALCFFINRDQWIKNYYNFAVINRFVFWLLIILVGINIFLGNELLGYTVFLICFVQYGFITAWLILQNEFVSNTLEFMVEHQIVNEDEFQKAHAIVKAWALENLNFYFSRELNKS